MKTKQVALGVISAAAISLPSLAMAQSTMDSMKKSMTGPESGWFVGGSIGQSKIDCDTGGVPGVSCDDSDTAFRVFGGYQINKHFGVEVGYADLGKATVSGGGLTAEVKATAWDIMAVGTLPVTNNFSVYGKLGWFTGEAKLSSNSPLIGSGKESNSDLTYAVGVQYDFNKNLGIRGEWQQYKSLGEDTDVDVMSIGVVYRFK